MNDSQFEQELRATKPATPSAQLWTRINNDLSCPREPAASAAVFGPAHLDERFLFRLLRGCGWAVVGATACALFVALSANHRQAGRTRPTQSEVAVPSGSTTYEPAEAVRTLVATEDDGLVFDEESTPLRQVRYNYVERHAWTNPATGARLEVELPREDTYLISVSIQ